MHNKSLFTATCFGLLIVLLGGCQSTDDIHRLNLTTQQHIEKKQSDNQTQIKAPLLETDLFARQHFSAASIFALTPQQENAFFVYFNSPENADVPAYLRVSNYLEAHTRNFTFRGTTLSASDALALQEGNCMSLAVLTTALAKLANVPYKHRKVHSAPVFSEVNDVQMLSTHLNVRLFDTLPKTEKLIIPASVVIDYFKDNGNFTSSRVDKDELLIMYWHNLASDALLQNDLALAYSYTMMAHDIEALHPETLNLRAIIYKRAGKAKSAAQIYEFALKHKLHSVSIIDNYASMLAARGETKRARELQKRTRHINDDNPYLWLKKAKNHFQQGNYRLAQVYLLKSIHKGPYIHESQFLLAKVYHALGKSGAMRTALEKAEQIAYLPDDKKRYRAKLLGLQSSNE